MSTVQDAWGKQREQDSTPGEMVERLYNVNTVKPVCVVNSLHTHILYCCTEHAQSRPLG